MAKVTYEGKFGVDNGMGGTVWAGPCPYLILDTGYSYSIADIILMFLGLKTTINGNTDKRIRITIEELNDRDARPSVIDHIKNTDRCFR